MRAIGTLTAGFVGLALAACAGGGSPGAAEEPAAGGPPAAPASVAAPAPAPSGEGERAAAAAAPADPRAAVVALVEAFRAGDRDRVDALWARDGGTWTDAAGFRRRAAAYQATDFDLDPGAMTTFVQGDTTTVAVPARRDGAATVWTFRVREIDGVLRVGGVETRPAGMP